jgi:hypothetical protein
MDYASLISHTYARRVPNYAAALSGAADPLEKMRSMRVVGRPSTFDFVFCRDLVAERMLALEDVRCRVDICDLA